MGFQPLNMREIHYDLSYEILRTEPTKHHAPKLPRVCGIAAYNVLSGGVNRRVSK